MKRSTLIAAMLVIALTLYLGLFSGCETLRKSPTESQKQTARLGLNATEQIRLAGTEPQSPESMIAHESAKATQTYFGPPAEPLAEPDKVIPKAQVQAAERSNPRDAADSIMGIGTAIALVFGGGTGVKIASAISAARKKSKALRQIIQAEEDFRNELKTSTAIAEDEDEAVKAAETLESLKDKNQIQSASTQQIVSEVKDEIKRSRA